MASLFLRELPYFLLFWVSVLGFIYYFDDLSFLNPYWDKMVDSYSEFTITSIFSFFYHELLYFGFGLFWFVVDLIPAFKKYKIQPSKPFAAEDQWKCFKGLMFSHIVIQFPMMLLTHHVLKVLGFRLSSPLPRLSVVMLKVVGCFLIEDFYFYWIHRFLHWDRIYKYIHKMHHVHKAPFGIAAEYAHPVETFFLGIGTILGPFFLSRHLFELWVWLFFRLMETVEDHAGYELPFNPTRYIPFWAGATHHDFHHEKFDGNFASVFTIWDYVFGTDVAFRKHHFEKEQEGQCLWTDLFEKMGMVPSVYLDTKND